LIFTAEIVSLVQSIGVCGVRDVKLLLPDIIKKEFVPGRGCAGQPKSRKLEPFTTLLHLV